MTLPSVQTRLIKPDSLTRFSRLNQAVASFIAHAPTVSDVGPISGERVSAEWALHVRDHLRDHDDDHVNDHGRAHDHDHVHDRDDASAGAAAGRAGLR
jgi:hypothetical protein